MKDIEKLINEADFSKETAQKNQLYYELFRKPVPIYEPGGEQLTEIDLGFVNGGVSRSMPADPADGKEQPDGIKLDDTAVNKRPR